MNLAELNERISFLQSKIDSGRFTGAERQERDRLTEKYFKQLKEKEDRDKLSRTVNINVHEIDMLLQLVSGGITDGLRNGDEDKVNSLSLLKDKLKKAVVKGVKVE
jgi:uncharacterized protein YnzC (UPF0291/DUF896 family)